VARPLSGGLAHVDAPGLEVDVGVQHQFQRHRLRPQLAADLEAKLVVVVHLFLVGNGFHPQGLGQDPGLVLQDCAVHALLERLEINR
jgi:hypothetical protein